MHFIDCEEQQAMLREQAERTARTIEVYRREKYALSDRVQSMEDVVFFLLGKDHWEVNLAAYQDMAVALLKLLLQPGVTKVLNKQFSPEERTAAVGLLHALYAFFKELGDEQYRTVFEHKFVRYHYAGDNLKRLHTLEHLYREKLDFFLSEKSGGSGGGAA